MANDSSVAGFLTPTFDLSLEDDALIDFLQPWIVGLTGIADKTLVMPRWQEEPPNLPDQNTDWIAFGLHNSEPDIYAAELHYQNVNGYNEVRRHEIMEFLLSFYGPNSRKLASYLRDGVQLSQNREYLSSNGFGFVNSSNALTFNELIKKIWYKRTDMRIFIKYQNVRQYGVLNITSASFTLQTDE